MAYTDAVLEDSEVYRMCTEGQTAISENFYVYEFACNDGTDVVLVHPQLLELLEDIRARVGEPIGLTNGFRTGAHNEAIGGADDSKHLYGFAADIYAENTEAQRLAAIADELGAGGVGYYDDFAHVDVAGKRRRWDNRN